MATESMTVQAPTGERWTVQYRTGVQRARTGLGNASGVAASRYVAGILATYADTDGTVHCAACSVVCSVGRGTVVTLDDGRTVMLATAEADRAVADLPGWTFTGPAVPYSPATVLPVCPLHNGDSGARAALTDAQRTRLEHAAHDALNCHAIAIP